MSHHCDMRRWPAKGRDAEAEEELGQFSKRDVAHAKTLSGLCRVIFETECE